MTLPGHKEAISDVVYNDSNEIFSASMDHTIKLWDSELGGLKSEIAGNKSFFSLSWSPLNRNIITSSADRHIRLYDPRSTGEQLSLNKAQYLLQSILLTVKLRIKTNDYFQIVRGIAG